MQNDPSTPPTPAAAPPAPRTLTRRALRALAWTVAGLVALLLVLGALAWWWIGSNQSLAFALARAAQYMPAGQTLESREVTGSLRTGGRIGWLRWQSESLAVEVHEAEIGWQLAPLFQRKLQLGEVHAARLLVERRGPPSDAPAEPLAQLTLPIEVELPFRIDELRWAGPPPLQAARLAGRYRYTDARHALEIEHVDIADGRYSASVTLQGAAPMALEAALQGRVKAPLPEDRSIEVLAEAGVKGTLAGREARLEVAAALAPAEPDAEAPMEAKLQAHVAPWQPQPVIDARADLRNLDAASLWPGAPRTRLTGTVELQPDAASGPAAWQASADLANALPGPWDKGALPIERIEARVGFDGTNWRVPAATLRAGGGRIEAEGRWSPAPAPWQARATVRGVRPGLLHSELSGAPVNGTVTAQQRDDAAIGFDVALRAEGGAGTAALPGFGLERVLAQGQWKEQVLDLRSLRLEAERASLEGRLSVRVAEQAASGRLALALPGGGAQLEGTIAPAQGGGELKARIDDAEAVQRWVEGLPEMSALFGGRTARGAARLDARWQGGWQTIQRRLENANAPAPRGAAEPTLQASLDVPRVELRLPPAANGAAATTVQIGNLQAALDGSLARATLALKGEAATGTQKLELDARANGGIAGAGQWRAALASLRLQARDSARPGPGGAAAAPWTLELGREVTASIRSSGSAAANRLEVEASAATATLRGPVPGTVRIEWQPLRFTRSGAAPNQAFRLRSQGRLQGLPMAWAEAFGANAAFNEIGISGDLLFDGEWDIDAGDTLRARARLARQSGDIRVQAGEAALVTRIRSHGTGTASERTMNAAGAGGAAAPSTPAGLRRAELRLDAEGDAVRATLAWDSERAGRIDAELATRMQQRADGWQWAADAPLAGRIKATLPNLGVWSMLAPPGWRIAGTLDADAVLAGNRAAPRWNGTLGADRLALRAPVEGLDLQGGRLRATLTGERIEITEFTLQGGAGTSARIAGQSGNRSTAASEAAAGGGSLTARGDITWGAAGPTGSGIRMALQAELRALRVLVRTDRQVTLSGNLQARLDGGQFSVRGKLRTDRAVIILPDETAPSLGTDVVVRSAAKDREAAEQARREAARSEAQAARPQTAKPPDIVVEFDLGDDFAVQGRGITTRLEGELEIRSTRLDAPPRITGEVRTVKGQYRAYGQQLDVESGIARFNGPFDNPALDILAIRPNIAQRAGVQISGTAQSPRVKLYSEPPLSDAETLSWVVLGRASATSGGESALLQQAALALIGRVSKGATGGSLASRFGLDELGFKGPGNGGDLRESAVTLGKRLSKDFYLTYERSLGGTFGTIFIFYDLTQRLTLRGQAGQTSGVDLIYTLKYD